MPTDLRHSQLKLFENEVLLVRDHAERIGLEIIASILAMALLAVKNELSALNVLKDEY